MLREPELTEDVIGACIEVHRHFGPGLLESIYETALCHELRLRRIDFECQVPIKLEYKGARLETDFRIDLIVKKKVILELKSVEKVSSIHHAQLLSYMRLTGIHTGLLVNFNASTIKDGLTRLVL